MKLNLDKEVYQKITCFSRKGDEFQKIKDFDKAINMYNQAILLLPEPKTSWEAATWILTAIGETYFFSKRYSEAEEALIEALKCPGGEGSPFIYLRLGQTYYELNKMKDAKEALYKAFKLDPFNLVFHNEDPKYFNLIKNKKA